MKHAISVITACCSLWCGIAQSSDSNPYNAYFTNAKNQCEKLAEANPPDAEGNMFSAEKCYTWQSQVAYHDNPKARDQYFVAALSVAPEYSEQTFDTALSAGFDTYKAVTLATTAYPRGEATFAQLAIAHGADPSQVTQATAAGRKKK